MMITDQADTGLVRPYGLAALGEPQGAGEAVEVDLKSSSQECVSYTDCYYTCRKTDCSKANDDICGVDCLIVDFVT